MAICSSPGTTTWWRRVPSRARRRSLPPPGTSASARSCSDHRPRQTEAPEVVPDLGGFLLRSVTNASTSLARHPLACQADADDVRADGPDVDGVDGVASADHGHPDPAGVAVPADSDVAEVGAELDHGADVEPVPFLHRRLPSHDLSHALGSVAHRVLLNGFSGRLSPNAPRE